MSYFKKRLNVILGDSFLSLSVLVTVVCCFLHAYQFWRSGFHYQPLVRLVFAAAFPFIVFFGGRLASYWCFYAYACVLIWIVTFQNYTAFVIVVLFTLLVPRMRIPTLVFYGVEVFVAASVRHFTPIHVLIHFSNCCLIYFALYFLVKPSVQNKKLNLKYDERLLLEELRSGKLQKEISLFSPNTTSSKLKQARQRNGCATTDELLQRFVAES